MKRVTIHHAGKPPVASGLYTAPHCCEVHLSEGVAKILGGILDINISVTGAYPSSLILPKLNTNMEHHKVKMQSVGLEDKDFRDLILTLRAMTQYARDTGAFIQFETLREEILCDDSGEGCYPYG